MFLNWQHQLNRGLCEFYLAGRGSRPAGWKSLVTGKSATITGGGGFNLNFGAVNNLAYQSLVCSSTSMLSSLPVGLHGATSASMTLFMRNTNHGINTLPVATGTTDDYWPYIGLGYVGIFRSARVDAIGLGGIEHRDWTHLTFTTNGTNWVMYQNGLQIHSVAAEATVTATKLNIGVNGAGSSSSCTLASVRVWRNRALSANEVMEDYIHARQGYTGLFTKPVRPLIYLPAAPAGNRRRRVLLCGRGC